MKKYIITTAVFCFAIVSQLLATEEYDAEYIIHETHEEFHAEKGKKFKEFIHEVEVHRKIRILTQNGLEKYNRLYIPTFEDLDFRSLVFELSAKTIKQNGEEITVDESSIKETTLPGNNRYLRNYEGAVKLVALQQVDIGDVIEYSYKVRYINDFSGDYLESYERVMAEEIPIRTYTRTIKVENRLQSRLLEYNLTDSHTKEKGDTHTTYAWRFLGVEAQKREEEYSYEYSKLPYVSILISTYKLDFNKSWEEVMDDIDREPKGRYRFIADIRLYELVNLAKTKNTVEEKVRLICDTLYSWRRDTIESRILMSNWYLNNKYLSLFKKLDIPSSLIKLKPLSEGAFDEEVITLYQFETGLLEFEDESGQRHYMTPNAAFVNIDYIPFEFQGSRALRFKELLSDSQMEVFTMPYLPAESQSTSEERTITLSVKEDSLHYDVNLKRKVKGYPYLTYTACYLHKDDSLLHLGAKETLDKAVFGRKSIDVTKSEWKAEVQDYYTGAVEISGTCQAKEEITSLYESVALWQLVDIDQFDYWLEDHRSGQERYSDAHITAAYTGASKMTLLDNSLCSPRINEFMNVSFTNDYGTIECSTTIEDGNVLIDLVVTVKKGFVPSTDWEEFVNFDRTLHNLLLLEIPLVITGKN